MLWKSNQGGLETETRLWTVGMEMISNLKTSLGEEENRIASPKIDWNPVASCNYKMAIEPKELTMLIHQSPLIQWASTKYNLLLD